MKWTEKKEDRKQKNRRGGEREIEGDTKTGGGGGDKNACTNRIIE